MQDIHERSNNQPPNNRELNSLSCTEAYLLLVLEYAEISCINHIETKVYDRRKGVSHSSELMDRRRRAATDIPYKLAKG